MLSLSDCISSNDLLLVIVEEDRGTNNTHKILCIHGNSKKSCPDCQENSYPASKKAKNSSSFTSKVEDAEEEEEDDEK